MAKVIFLTRGDASFGTGHLHRTNWLSAGLLGSGTANLNVEIRCLDSPLARAFPWVGGCGVGYFGSQNLMAQNITGADIAVVDWLDSAPELVLQLKGCGAKVLLLDDYGAAQQHADVVVNSLLAALDSTETKVGSAQVYSGANWLHLPPLAVQLRGGATATARAMEAGLQRPVEVTGNVHSVLVNFGGSPVDQAIGLALEALAMQKYGGKVLVIPAPNKCNVPAGLDVDFLPASDEFHGLLAASDMAILAGGLSLYQAAFFGVPSLCIALNGHQRLTALKLERAGCCRNFGLLGSLTAEALAPGTGTILRAQRIRRLMSRRGSRLFDGQGVSRTVDLVLSLA